MVRSVDFAVTVKTCLGEQEFGRRARRQPVRSECETAVARRRVACLAELRRSANQERGLVRPMRRVTERAILDDRRVLPQNRPPEFGMARQAGFACRRPDVELGVVGAVGIVAVAANELAVAQRMGGAFERIRRHVAVATPTGLILTGQRPNHIDFGVDGVTVRTRQFGPLVRASRPTCPFIGTVTLQTQPVLQGRFRIAPMSKVQHRLAFDTRRQDLPTVVAHRTVTGLALQARRESPGTIHREGRADDARVAVDGREHVHRGERLIFVVAAKTAISASARVVAGL